ncbi:MAG: hypothetical protein MH204_08475 [Fimbriimonadaceae bacterium]|nr:hypothetical protein [Fimbriimonadaceae bacterium]
MASGPWQVEALPDAGLSVMLPGRPTLAAGAARSEFPQSVDRKVWQASDDSVEARITFDRWSSVHFAPENMLDLYARRTLGIIEGFTIEPREIGSHAGALMVLADSGGLRRASIRVKSGVRAWQIDLIARTAEGLERSRIEEVVDSMILTAEPEAAGAYDEWGLPARTVRPAPRPAPAAFPMRILESAKLVLAAPFALREINARRSETEKSEVEAMSEWAGDDGTLAVFASYFRIPAGQELDLGGWVAAYGEQLRRDGYAGFQPAVRAARVTGAQGRIIEGQAEIDGRKTSVQIILLTRGRECWAIQSRVTDLDAAAAIQRRVAESIRIR